MKTPAKIIVIANGFQDDYIVNLVWGLSDICEVDLIGSSKYSKYKFNSNVRFINLRGDHDSNTSFLNKFIRINKYYLKLIWYLMGTRIKVVHIQWIHFYVEGIIISLFARSLRKKVVYTVHDVLPHDRNTLINRIIFGLIYRSQNILIAHTRYIKERLINEFRIPEKKVHIIKHGVYKVKNTKEISFESARKNLSLKMNDFVILFFGRIAKYKGIEILLSDFNKLKETKKDLKLIIAGQVSQRFEKEFYGILSRMVVNDIITKFYFIEANEVELLFKCANITILPYLEASQSGVLFLSYAYGIPVIAPKVGGFPDDIISGKTGLLFTQKEESNLYATITKAISTFTHQNEKLRDSIKKFAIQNYSWNTSCGKLSSIYRFLNN